MKAESETRAPVTGADLIEWGHRPGPAFPALLKRANAARAEGFGLLRIRQMLEADLPPPEAPKPRLRPEGAVPLHVSIDVESSDDEANVAQVLATMRALLRTPTLEAGAVMPDACPTGPLGTIPVGGVVAARNAIHPGMHSADICCSVMMSDLGHVDPKAVLDAASAITHFGPGGRKEGARFGLAPELEARFCENPLLSGARMLHAAASHMGTQGDGNHFLFVGRSAATGRVMLITHHGSRGPGGLLYKEGMAIAERFRRDLSPETLKQNAWIPADSPEGLDYWQALQVLRDWTKANHAVLHDAVAAGADAAVTGRIWNEHNFVFQRDGLFYHGKGATPAWGDYADDATGLTLIPLNMAQPVLVVRGRDAAHGLGFSPHGAGRNVSRSEHRRRMAGRTAAQIMAEETAGLDIRFHAGAPDISELPSSYKPAAAVIRQIEAHGLAEITDRIEPFGCIMAGDLPPFWQKKQRKAQ